MHACDKLDGATLEHAKLRLQFSFAGAGVARALEASALASIQRQRRAANSATAKHAGRKVDQWRARSGSPSVTGPLSAAQDCGIGAGTLCRFVLLTRRLGPSIACFTKPTSPGAPPCHEPTRA